MRQPTVWRAVQWIIIHVYMHIIPTSCVAFMFSNTTGRPILINTNAFISRFHLPITNAVKVVF